MDQHAQRLHSYIQSLEEEKRKIQVFRRELPLCLDLVNKAIENYRQQFSCSTTEYVHVGQSECSEQTSTWGPVLEEFIPIKRPCSGSDYNDDETEQDSGHKRSEVNGGLVTAAARDNKRKSDWLRSAQLWTQTSSYPPHKDDPPPKRVLVLEMKRNGGAFQPFERKKDATINHGSISLSSKPSSLSLDKTHFIIPSAATSSSAETVDASAVSSLKDREPAQPHRKQRLNWSPELHWRFLQALEQLGGSYHATPKRIRELMKVDVLTNDEVKSHLQVNYDLHFDFIFTNILQKYRLHTRRPGPTTIPAAVKAQAPPFVVVGGIWLPLVTTTASSEEPTNAPAVYAPLAAPPLANVDLKEQPDELEGRGSYSGVGEEGGSNRSNSPSTSSSTDQPLRPFPNDPL